MTTLHIVAKPGSLDRCLDMVRAGDAVLLIADGVYAAGALHEAQPAAPHAVLEDDADARGVVPPPGVPVRNYAGFVDWVVEHDNSVTWT